MVTDAERQAQRARPAPTANELRELAMRLRKLANDILQGEIDDRFAKSDAGRIPNPLVTGWYTRAVYWEDNEQQRLFHTICQLLGQIHLGRAELPIERLKSLAASVDGLASTLEPTSATAEAAERGGTKKPPRPPTKTERIRDQRIKFCWSKWHKSKTKGENEWRNIEEAYRKQIVSDPKLFKDKTSHDAIRLQHDRHCATCKHPTYFNPDGTQKAGR